MSSAGATVADLGLPVRDGAPAAPAGARSTPPPRCLARPSAGSPGGRGGPALAVTYLSLLVLLPLAALVTNAFSGGWCAFWAAVTQPEAVAALELTLAISAIVAVVNSVAGLAIAFVLVRDDFRGKALLGAVIDLPFALPTIVAGLTLLALYGANSPFHVDLAGTRLGIAAALLFVTLPFCVRSVQPVLAELDAEIEEAAASLGATRRQVLRRVDPAEHPARRCWPAPGWPSPGPWASTGRSSSFRATSRSRPRSPPRGSSAWSRATTTRRPAPSPIVLVAIALLVLLGIGWARRRFDVPESV